MAMPDKESIVAVIKDKYADRFEAVYGYTEFDQIDGTYEVFARAIAAYERSPEVLKFNSRFDRQTLTPVEEYGQGLFKMHCSSCHFMGRSRGDGPLFTSFGYANIGIPENPQVVGDENDLGLGAVVGEKAQEGKFKIPTLRNVEKTAPYGHNGYFPTLKDVVNFKNARDSMGLTPDVADNISSAIGNLGMTETQVDAVVQFLLTLSDQKDTLAPQTAVQGE
nr:cytochrome C peroxidase [uncultured bacterium]